MTKPLLNPWSEDTSAEDVAQASRGPQQPAPAVPAAPSMPSPGGYDEFDQYVAAPETTLTLPRRGGIRVVDAADASQAMRRILAALAAMGATRGPLEAILTKYGIVIAQMPQPPESGFFVYEAATKWALCAPLATTREQAVDGLWQALLHVARTPAYSAELQRRGIHPYRN